MTSPQPAASARLHPAWLVAAVAFLALVAAAGFRAAPSALIDPLQTEFGWTTSQITVSITINLLLYGLTAPFAAALIQRFGVRVIATVALLLVAAGAGLSVLARAPWALDLTWGVLIGLGTGSMALVFAAQIADTWFLEHRGLVIGILTAGGSTGQLVFLPAVTAMAAANGWRWSVLVVAAAALLVAPLVIGFLRDRPGQLGVTPYGAPADWTPPVIPTGNPARAALGALREASRRWSFWALVIGFFICGASTNGLVGVAFIPDAHAHGLPETAAAGLLAAVGVFDIVGTIASGWLTDRIDPRILLGIYYFGRGIGLAVLPLLLQATLQPPMLVFIIIYGLDWVATVPPTVALCRKVFGASGPLVFGWVFAAHQIGAATAAYLAGVVKDTTGQYTLAWLAGAGLCVIATAVSLLAVGPRRRIAAPAAAPAPTPAPAPAPTSDLAA